MIIGVATWRGTGATTVAAAIAASLAARGERPWLIEADPAGSVLAARAPRGALPVGGLELIAFPDTRSTSAHRHVDQHPDRPFELAADRFHRAAVDLGGVRTIATAGDPFRAWACHSPRSPWATALRELDGPVVVDLGRLRGGSPVQPVLDQLDTLLMIADADVVSVVSTMEWAAARGRAAPADATMPADLTRIALVDSPLVSDPIGRTDAAVELGDRLVGWLPWDPDAVRALTRGVPFDDRRLRRSEMVQAVHHLTDRLGECITGTAAA